MTFTKSHNKDNTAYLVSSKGKLVGKVRKVESWVARGGRIEWEAYRAGEYLGSFDTRTDAGTFLVNRA